jgi:ferrous iron transport protein B
MTCHAPAPAPGPSEATIALVGHPNVGKSALFHRLTGNYVNVSNYPGTTVETARAAARGIPGAVVVDTPGIVGLPGQTEDEAITTRWLLEQPMDGVIQVGDAKNLRRTLLLTLPLAEMGLPLVLALNMTDEARANGTEVDAGRLARRLGLPVVPTVATGGLGVPDLIDAVVAARPTRLHLRYPPEVEAQLADLEGELPQAPIGARSLALLWLEQDRSVEAWLAARLPESKLTELRNRRSGYLRRLGRPLGEIIHLARNEVLDEIVGPAETALPGTGRRIGRWLGRLSLHPLWGIPVLLSVLLAVYLFVGVFGAQTLVGWLEGRLFGEIINPWISGWVTRLSPASWLSDLLVGPYGLWTMGLTYAVALILPIVATFFLAFGVLEDTGYLPRLAVLTHNLFRLVGLNGKAVLPMILGLGCVTTATVTTRILETRRERLLATLLLALAVPCSAQLGVVLGILASISFSATLIWAGVVLGILLCIGWLAALLVPGQRTALVLEVPPLRLPQPANVAIKTVARVEWYMREVAPFFLAGALLVFVLDRTGWLAGITRLGEPLVTAWLGLPAEASLAFVLGFLRRDFGASGLFALASLGRMTPLQSLVGMVTITLFVPCIAAVLMIARERGWRTAAAILGLVFPLAFLAGGLLRFGLTAAGWGS